MPTRVRAAGWNSPTCSKAASGATNADSPLYKREWNLTLFAGVSFALYRSERTVDSASEPFD